MPKLPATSRAAVSSPRTALWRRELARSPSSPRSLGQPDQEGQRQRQDDHVEDHRPDAHPDEVGRDERHGRGREHLDEVDGVEAAGLAGLEVEAVGPAHQLPDPPRGRKRNDHQREQARADQADGDEPAGPAARQASHPLGQRRPGSPRPRRPAPTPSPPRRRSRSPPSAPGWRTPRPASRPASPCRSSRVSFLSTLADCW